jgi:hypothetical protein
MRSRSARSREPCFVSSLAYPLLAVPTRAITEHQPHHHHYNTKINILNISAYITPYPHCHSRSYISSPPRPRRAAQPCIPQIGNPFPPIASPNMEEYNNPIPSRTSDPWLIRHSSPDVCCSKATGSAGQSLASCE